MSILRVTGTAYLTAIACSLFACGAADSEADITAVQERFSTSPGEPNHEDITRAALDFLRPEIVTAITVANVSTDVQFALVNANHFDDCNFSGGSLVVSSSEAQAVSNLDPALPAAADAAAILDFGRALHAVQDFYAHSNWVELGGTVLVDDALTAFPTLTGYSVLPSSGFVVVQGTKPMTAVTRKDDAAYPESAIVRVKWRKEKLPGLMSGTVDYEPGDACPASVAMTHSELNKDKLGNPGRESQFLAAKSLAIAQTTHEWCRLNELVRVAWGDAGTARLAGWLAPSALQPDCAGGQ